MTDFKKTVLSKQEIKWISEQKITRLTDNQEVLIYPMGAERYLSLVLSGEKPSRYPIKKDIDDKHILVIPGYGNSAFLFAQAGAKSVTVYDKDPVTIAWIKAFKRFYHFREYDQNGEPFPSIGALLEALTCWYPPLLPLPQNRIKLSLLWALNPKALRKIYLFYIVSLVQKAILSKSTDDFELEHDIQFFAGDIYDLSSSQNKPTFDTAFVPYLLGVKNGIEKEADIVAFMQELLRAVPKGTILVSPARSTKEFNVLGQSYFITTGYSNIKAIPGLQPYFKGEDENWFKTQGLAIFG